MAFQQVTLTQLLAALAARYNSVPYWSTAEATSAINEVLRTWNMLTGMWKRRVLIPTVAATSTNFPTGHIYQLPSTMIFNMRIEWNQKVLDQSSISDLNNGRTNWRRELISDGGSVPARVALWAPVGLMALAIWPGAPEGGTLIVDGVRATPILTAGGDFVDLGQFELDTLLDMALHLLAFKLGGSLWKATLPHYKQFVEAAGDQNARLKSSTWYRKIMGLDEQRWQHPAKIPNTVAAGDAPPRQQQ